MQRREFMTTACAAGVAIGTAATVVGQGTPAGNRNPNQRQFIELRKYTVATPEMKAKLLDVLDAAFVPALNRAGSEPVGVFYTDTEWNEGKPDFDLNVFMLIPYANVRTFQTSVDRLLADEQFKTAAEPMWSATSKAPLYTACQSSLYYGFEGCPKIEVPSQKPERVLQLRFYRSFNIERNAAKVHMFEQGGELALFRKVGMNPVFFGTAMIGELMPNLTYMLGFDSLQAKVDAWKTFVDSDEWKAMKGLPMYKDTATQIVNVMLKPSKGSQV